MSIAILNNIINDKSFHMLNLDNKKYKLPKFSYFDQRQKTIVICMFTHDSKITYAHKEVVDILLK